MGKNKNGGKGRAPSKLKSGAEGKRGVDLGERDESESEMTLGSGAPSVRPPDHQIWAEIWWQWTGPRGAEARSED